MLTTVRKMFIARWLGLLVRSLRRCCGLPAAAVVRRQGINWFLDLNEGIDLSVYVLGSFEPLTLKQYKTWLKPGGIALDVGANVGAHALPMAKLVGAEGHIYAFEPTLYAFGKLQENLARNPDLSRRVTAVHTYLVREAGGVVPDSVFSSWPLRGGAGLHPLHCGQAMPTGDADAVTLDEFVWGRSIPHIDFIKIDVDGAEAAVLAGARETIGRFSPPLLVEFAPQLRDENDAFDEMVGLLNEMHYVFHDFRRGRVLPSEPDNLRKQIKVGHSINVLCLPKPEQPN